MTPRTNRLHTNFASSVKQGVEQVKRVTITELGAQGYADLRIARRMEREFRVFQTESPVFAPGRVFVRKHQG